MTSDALSPGFLLAPPPLSDPHFDRTLVLLAVHEPSGSMGFVVNRPSDIGLHQLLGELEIEPRAPDRPVLLGGPVSGFSGFVMYEHPRDTPCGPGFSITPTLSVSPARDVLEAGAKGALPGRFELLLGYAGWGASQLDDELAGGAWLHAPFDAELLFDVPMAQRWQEAYARLGVNPHGFVIVPGGAQA